MFRLNKHLLVYGAALAALWLARGAWGQEMQEVQRADGTTIKVPSNLPPEVLEGIRSGSGPRPTSESGNPEEKGEKTEADAEGKDDEKKGEDSKQADRARGRRDEKQEEKKPEEATDAVKRDSPAEPGDPQELEVEPDAEGMVEFNFANQKWLGVLDWLARISKMSLDWQELPGDHLNLVTQRKHTLRETRDLINQHLLQRGFTLLQQGDVLFVVKIDKLNPAMVPRVRPEELAQRDPHEWVKVSFPLDWMLAEDAAKEYEPMKSPHGKLTALKTTNRLEAMDAVVNLRHIYEVIREEQSGAGEEGLVRVFRLKNTAAESVVEQLGELLGLESKSKRPAPPMSPDQMRAQMEAMKQAQAQAQEAAKKPGGPTPPKPEVRLVANKQENSVLAVAPPDKMAIIEQAIKALDVPRDYTGLRDRTMIRWQVYFLQSIQPEPLIKTLEQLGEFDYYTRLEADPRNNAIIAYASLADHLTISSLIEKLDQGGRGPEVIKLEGLRAESAARTIAFIMLGEREESQEDASRSSRYSSSSSSPYDYYRSRYSSSRRDDDRDQFRVTADAKTNTLYLWCNRFELAKVEDILESLRRSQGGDDGEYSVKVYRLVSLAPEPFVKTLEKMETLGFQTRLEIDRENETIIAHATEADHAKIRELIEKLDGSSREIHVIPLRRLEADYVAGTIAYLMGGKEEKEDSRYNRPYYYDFYGSSSPRSGQEKKQDEFRVDADVAFNRLLVWANEFEVEEVMNLLVKLGEIPPEGGDTSTIRVLDVPPGPEREKLLERIRRIWPTLAPNPLIPPDAPEQEPSEKEEKDEKTIEEKSEEKAAPPESRSTTASARSGAADPVASRSEAGGANVGGQGRPVFQLALLEQPGAESPADPPSGESPEEAKSPPEAGQAPDAEADNEALPAEPPKESAAPPSAAPPPVSVTEAADGRLIITSEDTKALDRLEDLIGRLSPGRKEYHVFKLLYAQAYWVKWNLEDFFKEEDKSDTRSSRYYSWYWDYPSSSGSKDTGRRLSQRRPLRFISDDDTNTILVQGASPEQLATIADLIELYDQRPAMDSESTRRTEVFVIRYSKADVVAEAVKDVYRDLLSDRDKALAGRGDQQQRGESRYSYTYVLGGEESDRKMPRWKGYLSIGIDELSNTLIVSAPEFLFRDVEKLIKSLDEAARPSDSVGVVQLGHGVSAAVVQEALGKVLSESAAGARRTQSGGATPGQSNSRRSSGRYGRPGD